ncbi:MAG: ABC transporter ATP-binding protein [Chitinispirillaceae bacterium]|nr:ABC transporter ATP-binding protein [Chitinispirillaceae bacterium]
MVDLNMPLLDVRNVTVSFRIPRRRRSPGEAGVRFTAVDDVSFALPKGTTVGLVGESGCGKTTLCRAIARFRKVDSGTILLEGKDLSLLSGNALRRQRRRMQMIFQNPFASLDPRMTVGDALDEALAAVRLRPKRERTARAASLLEQVGLDPGMMCKFPHEFSGGQRQRIAIARALAAEPALIIADEPVSSLDVSIAAQVLNLLHDLRDRLGLTMLFISHDLSVVRFIAHRIIVMYRGRIVESGPAEELFSAPRHPYTVTLLKAVPVIGDPVSAVPFYEAVPPHEKDEPQPGGCGFVPRCEHVQEHCREHVPKLQPINAKNGHFCACFRAGQLDAMR